ncbi:4-hydroxyphenylacetate 3-monooxygenase, oxygenase component [Virgibacillus kimchii]
MPAITGNEYIQRMDRLDTTIWYDGKKIKGKKSEHPVFKGVLKTQSELYDLQHKKDKRNLMTYESPTTGSRIGTSYLMPTTKEDLQKRSKMIQEWAKLSNGMLGRSPDYMNTTLMSLAASANLLKGKKNCYPENLLHFYEYAREKDLTFTHTFVNPQVNRSPFYMEDDDEPISARIMNETKEGIVIRGAKLLATQGGITDELLVFSPGGVNNEEQAFAFSIPSDTEGLSFICRESFHLGDSQYNYPLSSRFEEMDTIVVLEDVLIPWRRIFFYKNIPLANSFQGKSAFRPFALHQVLNRRIIKTDFFLNLAEDIIQTIDIGSYSHVHEKMTEIIVTYESMKALLIKAEANAAIDEFGLMRPEMAALQSANSIFPHMYPRMVEIIQLLSASGLVTIPKEDDFKSDIRPALDQYLQSAKLDAEERVKLFRLAWDATMSPFGTRQTQYERFFFGNPIAFSTGLYRSYFDK